MGKDKKKKLLPKSSLVIRFIAGMYLVYLAYELFMGLSANIEGGAPQAVSIGSAVVFGVCGLILVIFSGKDFIKGNFQGGIMDTSEEENSLEKM